MAFSCTGSVKARYFDWQRIALHSRPLYLLWDSRVRLFAREGEGGKHGNFVSVVPPTAYDGMVLYATNDKANEGSAYCSSPISGVFLDLTKGLRKALKTLLSAIMCDESTH